MTYNRTRVANFARGCYWQVQLRRSLKQAFFSFSVSDMVYSRYEKQRIHYHRFKGLKAPTIAKILVEEGLCVTRHGTQSFLKRYRETRMADGQAMGGHLLSQKMSRRLWRLKCRLVSNFEGGLYHIFRKFDFFFLPVITFFLFLLCK